MSYDSCFFEVSALLYKKTGVWMLLAPLHCLSAAVVLPCFVSNQALRKAPLSWR